MENTLNEILIDLILVEIAIRLNLYSDKLYVYKYYELHKEDLNTFFKDNETLKKLKKIFIENYEQGKDVLSRDESIFRTIWTLTDTKEIYEMVDKIISETDELQIEFICDTMEKEQEYYKK